jgi:predicted tellurium resistance membrane protein TerC
MFCSALVAKLMNKYPWLVILGGAILGYVAGEMIVADRWISPYMGEFKDVAGRVLPLLLAAAVCVAGRWSEFMGRVQRRRRAHAARQEAKP